MRKLILLNNQKTTLNNSLALAATTLNRALLTQDIIPVDDLTTRGEYEIRVTLTDDTNIEIINLIFDNGAGVISLERGVEGTLTRLWGAGTKFEFRLTAGMLDRIGQVFNLGRDFSGHETGIAAAVANNTTWPPSTLVNEGDYYVLKSGANFTHALLALKSGMTDTITPAPATLDTLIKDFQVYWLVIHLLSDGSINNPGSRLGNTDSESLANGFNSLSFGNNNVANGFRTVAIGSAHRNYGERAITLGTAVNNFANEALVIMPNGSRGYSTPNVVDNALVLDYLPSKVPAVNFPTASRGYTGSAEGVIWTPPMDLTGGAAWLASANVKHGHVRRPTVANGFQYLRFDDTYLELFGKYKADYVNTGLTGASQPAWDTTPFGITVDGNGQWITLPNVGMTLTLPDKFIPKEIGVLVLDYAAITAQPSLSFGKSGNNALFKANGATTQLTAVDKVQLYSVAAPEATDTLTFSINTLATGTLLLCQFFVRGQLCPRWY